MDKVIHSLDSLHFVLCNKPMIDNNLREGYYCPSYIVTAEKSPFCAGEVFFVDDSFLMGPIVLGQYQYYTTEGFLP